MPSLLDDPLAPQATSLLPGIPALTIAPPDPAQPDVGTGLSDLYNSVTAELSRQRQISRDMGLWTGGGLLEGGHPTMAGVADAANKVVQGILMGSTAPTMKLRGGGIIGDIRPPTESVADTINANFEYGRDVGPRSVPATSLAGGVDMTDPAEAKRVDTLQQTITGDDGYWSRPIVDTDGNVIEGQHRVEAARALGASSIPVHVVQDVGKGLDTAGLRAAMREAQPGLHPDQAHQLTQYLAEAWHDEGGANAVRQTYAPPPGFANAWNAGLNYLAP